MVGAEEEAEAKCKRIRAFSVVLTRLGLLMQAIAINIPAPERRVSVWLIHLKLGITG